MGVIFVAGIYGVGKSTLCEKVSELTSIPFYSAGDLISEVNGEIYGANKAVKDKDRNQDILIEAVRYKLQSVPKILLAGHFCIFDRENNVIQLPEYVFESMDIENIILLEASCSRVLQNIQSRDAKEYNVVDIKALKDCEHIYAYKTAEKFEIPIATYEMTFTQDDVDEVLRRL